MRLIVYRLWLRLRSSAEVPARVGVEIRFLYACPVPAHEPRDPLILGTALSVMF